MRPAHRLLAGVLAAGALLAAGCAQSADAMDPMDPIERLGRKAAQRVGPHASVSPRVPAPLPGPGPGAASPGSMSPSAPGAPVRPVCGLHEMSPAPSPALPSPSPPFSAPSPSPPLRHCPSVLPGSYGTPAPGAAFP
ncbi:hypothetical protein OIE62_25490 [Streptomyces scopuliridis]|uniref:Uncharacterized protein n=2 Tax=Streptomyces scopuliridis TaxID=452529 RepID=A0A2T7T4T6_9ACTN|nr:hypothetical protein [Streptomyces scopuliridis]PVE10143.1 hypothetical protein Y717_01400 [Streptomyces scopuliridis RB72]WSB98282.1 hypothetical protein OG835_15450 [Streptomyces scopuliridis]WSC08016.1 hypothetical protein OIE62_25490 [Streptomyces scopuliridis]